MKIRFYTCLTLLAIVVNLMNVVLEFYLNSGYNRDVGLSAVILGGLLYNLTTCIEQKI
jgi:hypothetical protein